MEVSRNTFMKKLILLLPAALLAWGLQAAQPNPAAPKPESLDDKLAILKSQFPKAVDIYDNNGKATPAMNSGEMRDTYNKYKRVCDSITLDSLADDIKKLKALIRKDYSIQKGIVDKNDQDRVDWVAKKQKSAFLDPPYIWTSKALLKYLDNLVNWEKRLEALIPPPKAT